MTPRLYLVILVILVATMPILAGCSVLGEAATSPSSDTPVEGTASPAPTAIRTPTVTTTPVPISTPNPVPTSTPVPSPTPEPTPSPVPIPEPMVVSQCCGLFSWIDAESLLSYDVSNNGDGSSWITNAYSGARAEISNRFGFPNRDGLIASYDAGDGVTEILDRSGAVVGRVATGDAPAWISPDSSRIAWLENLPIRTPSSSVNRAVRLWVANTDGSVVRPLLDLQASALHWLPDNQRIVVSGRTLEGAESGIWVIDIDSGSVRILVNVTFPQSVQVSPDGRFVAYMVTFSGDASQDGVWIADVDGERRWQTTLREGYRWARDSQSLWVLELASVDERTDRLIRVNAETGELLSEHPLRFRVHNHEWSMSPDDHAVAYWREEDGHVVVEFFGPQP